MTDETKPQTDADSRASVDRGMFDFPDFGAMGRNFVAWAKANPGACALGVCLLAVLGYFYFGVKAFQSLSQTSAQWIAASWNEENDQEHCVGIIPVALLLVLLRWRDLRAAPKEPSKTGLWWVVAGVLLFVVGVRCIEGRYTIFALTPLIYGGVIFLYGKKVARIVLFPCVFLLFMTPIGGVVQGTAGLQSKTAVVIESLSSICGIRIHAEGAKIFSLDGRFEPLEVAGGCSGIRSLMAMLTLAALYAYFAMRTPIRGLVLFGCSLLFAILGNFARVFSVVVFARFFDPKIATGLYHDYSGFIFFPVAVLAMIGAGNVINRDWSSWWKRAAAAATAEATPVQKAPIDSPSSALSTEPPKPEKPSGSYDY